MLRLPTDMQRTHTSNAHCWLKLNTAFIRRNDPGDESSPEIKTGYMHGWNKIIHGFCRWVIPQIITFSHNSMPRERIWCIPHGLPLVLIKGQTGITWIPTCCRLILAAIFDDDLKLCDWKWWSPDQVTISDIRNPSHWRLQILRDFYLNLLGFLFSFIKGSQGNYYLISTWKLFSRFR